MSCVEPLQDLPPEDHGGSRPITTVSPEAAPTASEPGDPKLETAEPAAPQLGLPKRRRLAAELGRPERRRPAAAAEGPNPKEFAGVVTKPWLVHVSSTPHDGGEVLRHSGIVIRWDKDKAWILTSYRAIFCTLDEKLYDPMPKLAVHVPKAVHLPNNGIFEGEMLLSNEVYQFAVLTIKVEAMLEMELPTFGRSPLYGDEVSTLALNEKLSMKLCRGTIKWLEEDHFVFLSCRLCPCGVGGPVINRDGDVVGMACEDTQQPTIVGITIIHKSIEMWTKFGHFARPRLGMCFSTVALLDLQRQYHLRYKYGINNGLIVDEVVFRSTAEKRGVRRGDVITSFNGMSCYLPEFEDFLLSIAAASLDGTNQVTDFKLEVHNLLEQAKRTIVLPVEISDGTEF
ncbi:hypothetical protein ACP70R_041340 [Stipagrostis hirtigluma subsp. patula]